MTATEVAPIAAVPAADKAPAAAPVAAAPVAAEPKADAAASLLASAAKAAESADYSTVKFEGAKDEFLGDYRSVAAELKLEPKAAQALLDKLFPKLIERSKATQKAQEEAAKKAEADERQSWRDELAKDPEFAADKRDANYKAIEIALKHAGKGIVERLQKDGLVSADGKDAHPAIERAFVNIGRRLLKATGPDAYVPGDSPTEKAPEGFVEKMAAEYRKVAASQQSQGRG